MKWLTSWILALNPLLLYRWYKPARLTLVCNKRIASVRYPQLKVYCMRNERTGECTEAFVMRAGSKGALDFTWQEDRQEGESVDHLMWRALRNASETYHVIFTKYATAFGVPPS